MWEPLSIDEAFLDVTILPSPIEEIARALQARINKELDLPCSLGGATNKLVAKTANTVGKARQAKDKPPNTITIVPAGEESQFMAALPIRRALGRGTKDSGHLGCLGADERRRLDAIGRKPRCSGGLENWGANCGGAPKASIIVRSCLLEKPNQSAKK